jgi:hypothetical protein
MATVLLDSNLLVLLVAGMSSREYIGKHRRLRDYSEEDFDLLIEFIRPMSAMKVTPNILTETSNLLSGIGEPARSHIADTFRQLIGSLDERFVHSTRAVEQPEFPRLWLTDAAVLTELVNSHVLLTADLDLYLAAVQRGYTAVNFNHLRQL